MPMPRKQDGWNPESGLADIIAHGLQQSQQDEVDLNVVDFARQYLNAYLWPTQRAILKAFYNLPMERGTWADIFPNGQASPEDTALLATRGITMETEWDERAILQGWVNDNRCTWVEGRSYSALSLEIGMRAGKCVTGDSLVYVDGYGHTAIADIVNLKQEETVFPVKNMKVATRFGLRSVRASLSNPSCTVIKMRTRHGIEIGGSAVHPVLTVNRTGDLVWKKLEEFSIGDYVVLSGGGEHFVSNPEPLQYRNQPIDRVKLAKVCGYLVGDGGVNSPARMELTGMDVGIRTEYIRLMSELFGLLPQPSSLNEKADRTPTIIFQNIGVRDFLVEEYGLRRCTAPFKVVPTGVMQGSREEVIAFLQGLFDTDGFATLVQRKDTNYNPDRITVGIQLASRKLLQQVQYLLLQLGILSTIADSKTTYIKENGEKAKAWVLRISAAQEVEKFKRTVGFTLERKQEVLEQLPVLREDDLMHIVRNSSLPYQAARLTRLKAKMMSVSWNGPEAPGRGHRAWQKISSVKIRKDDVLSKEMCARTLYYFRGRVPDDDPDMRFLDEYMNNGYLFSQVNHICTTEEPVYDLCVPDGEEYLANNVVVHNTAIAGVIAAYELYQLLKHDDPAARFGLLDGSLIIMLMLATSQEQTKRTVFSQFKARIDTSPYFKGLASQGKLISNMLNVECPKHSVDCIAGHSNGAGLVGGTQWVFLMDEGNRFQAEGGRSAMELWTNVGKGTNTLARFGAKKLVVSSAWEKGDITDVLYEQAQTPEGKDILAFQLTTFDVNWQLSREEGDIAVAYRLNEVEARRDYEGVRPGSQERFLDETTIGQAFCLPSIRVLYDPIKTVKQVRDLPPRHFVQNKILSCSKLPPRTKSYMHGDPGLKRDAFALMSAHGQVIDKQYCAVIDVALAWEAIQGVDGQYVVDTLNVEDVVMQLSEPLRIVELSFDHWQSATLIQSLYMKGINTKEITFSGSYQMGAYMLLRSWMNMGKVLIPHVQIPSIVTLRKELNELQVLNGKRVDHPKNGSKDLADCLAALVSRIAKDEARATGSSRGSQTSKIEQQQPSVKAGVIVRIAPNQRHIQLVDRKDKFISKDQF